MSEKIVIAIIIIIITVIIYIHEAENIENIFYF